VLEPNQPDFVPEHEDETWLGKAEMQAEIWADWENEEDE
jgi:hypothetical protein